MKDRCDGEDLEVTFLYAISDEPVNDKGDGNTEPDIILECDRVQLRAERQGPSNGRVYRLGWTAVDEAGNAPEEIEECIVVVPHDPDDHPEESCRLRFHQLLKLAPVTCQEQVKVIFGSAAAPWSIR